MSTAPKRKKVVKKKVVKKVIKKKVIRKQPPLSNGYSPKINYNGHSKMNPMSKKTSTQLHRTHRPSIEDAISRFTQIIADQTKFIEKLKQENQKLKNDITQLKNRPPEKIYIRKQPTRALPNINVGTPGPPATTNALQPPILKSAKSNPIIKNNNSGVVTNISKDDAKNALAGLFGAKKQSKQSTDDSGVVTNISKDDAKNALAGLFGAKKSKSAMVLPKDKNNKNYDNDDEKGINLKIKTPSRLEKYMKLGKIMPIHVVENRMKMDGITKLLIGQLTKQWISAIIPDNVSIIDKQVAPPPPMSKEFSDLIEKKDNNIDCDDDLFEKLVALGLKPKKKLIPSRKMKRFHWKKIDPELIPPTLWKDINDAIVVYNKVEFELKFQFRTPRPTQKKKGISKDRTGQIYTFVLPKRSQNIQIALSRFKLADSKIKRAVIEMDESVFGIETLESFLDIAPNEDEQRETEMHANKEDVDPQYFGRSEKFFYEFIDMVDLNIRLELWLFMQNFKEIVSDKQSQIYKLQSGIKSLCNSISFRNILQLLLAWGNHMNGGSHAGQAYGFEIDSLRLLSGVKTMDTSMNLMMYLYKTLYERYPDYLHVMTELKTIKVCSTMETEMLDKSIIELKDKFNLLENTTTRFEEDYLDVLPIEDKFIQYSKQWIKKNKKHLTKLIMMHRRTKNKCQQLGGLFNWDLEQNRIESLFSICNTFISDLYKARDDIHKLEIDREKRRRKQKRKKQKEIAKQQHKKKFANIQKPKRSIMDDVRNRKRKNTAILKKLGGKLDKSLVEKSKLIEATNYKKQLPEAFKKNKVKRKMSSVYNNRVKGTKTVPKGRLRLPSIVSKKGLPTLPSNNKNKNGKNNPNKKYENKIKITKKKTQDKRKRKRTKGWFEKGKEPKVNPQTNMNKFYAQPNIMSYNPLAQYEENYKNAYRRGRGISNNKDDNNNMKGNRWRSDTPTNPTALTQISKQDLKKGVSVAKKWSNAQHPALKNNNNKYDNNNIQSHKRAQSHIVHSSKRRLNRAACSPPNMGIVRLNKLNINNNNNINKTKKKSGADLNIPKYLADGQDEFLLLESPAASPEPSNRKLSNYQFTEENSWD